MANGIPRLPGQARRWERCDRPCAYRTALYEAGAHQHGCDYMEITGKSRVMTVYELLGVETLTPEARELLRPVNCPCFRAAPRQRGWPPGMKFGAGLETDREDAVESERRKEADP